MLPLKCEYFSCDVLSRTVFVTAMNEGGAELQHHLLAVVRPRLRMNASADAIAALQHDDAQLVRVRGSSCSCSNINGWWLARGQIRGKEW